MFEFLASFTAALDHLGDVDVDGRGIDTSSLFDDAVAFSVADGTMVDGALFISDDLGM